MVVEEISRLTIKPSSPTPNHLSTFHFSLIDQVSPPAYTPIFLFYGPPPDHDNHPSAAVRVSNISKQLRGSLSHTLTRFYPIAGRIKGYNNMFLECNDVGVDFIEARGDGSISDFMKGGDDLIHHLLPANIDLHADGIMNNDPQMIVKVTLFGCGGIAICICISHKIADASTFTTFINSWASTARDGSMDGDDNKDVVNKCCPTFESSVLYPPRKGIPAALAVPRYRGSNADNEANVPKISTKRFIFDAPKLEALRAKYSSRGMEKCPTRVEAVCALIWKTAVAASSSEKPCVAVSIVDIRRRIHPPLPPQAFGNHTAMATTPPVSKESISAMGGIDLVHKIREATSKIDCSYVKAMQGNEILMRWNEIANAILGAERYIFASWCRFPLYESDFGWGKPMWVTSGDFKPLKNQIILIDKNSEGDCIEVIVSLVGEETMAIFELDQELLEFATIMN